MLARNTTWTLTRDASLGLTFTGVNFYDGQGFMVPKKLNVKSAKQLKGATVCVQSGTTTELNLTDYSRANKLNIKPVVFEKLEAALAAYRAGGAPLSTVLAAREAALALALERVDVELRAARHWAALDALQLALAAHQRLGLRKAVRNEEEVLMGKVGFVPTSGAFQEQAVAIIKLHGREAAEEWLTGLRAFGKTYSNNMVALKAVENGEVATVLVNNYYWFALQREKGKLDSKLHYFTGGDVGGLITVSSAAVLKSSKHPKEAQQFLAFMASEEGQRVITQTTAEYPLHKGMVSDRGLKPFDELRPPKISPADLGNAEEALELEREVGLL